MAPVRGVSIVAAAVGVTALLPAPAQSTAGPVLMTTPGGTLSGYAPPVVAVPRGGIVTFVNGDPGSMHDVVSHEVGPADQPWCAEYTPGYCPLFLSSLVAVGQTSAVRGLANVQPGVSYRFSCTLHPQIAGTLLVLPE